MPLVVVAAYAAETVPIYHLILDLAGGANRVSPPNFDLNVPLNAWMPGSVSCSSRPRTTSEYKASFVIATLISPRCS